MNSSFWLIVIFCFSLFPRENSIKNDSIHFTWKTFHGKTQIYVCISHVDLSCIRCCHGIFLCFFFAFKGCQSNWMLCHQYQYFLLSSRNKSSIHGSTKIEQKLLKMKYFAKIAQSRKRRLVITWNSCAYDVRSVFYLVFIMLFQCAHSNSG